MAAMHEEEVLEPRECANCGAVDGLMVCSRCHTAWFCGAKCQKAYWPFHKPECKRNEFADMIEAQEPKFARWMRKHGKQAQIKDDEVDRIERAAVATSGSSREEVLESMYGRLNPKPKEHSYSAEEVIRMRRQEERDKAAARAALQQGKQYAAIELPADLGMDCQRYKWRQNQSHVEVFIPLPPGVPASKVRVELSPTTLAVSADEVPLLGGTLYRPIKRDESTWYIQDGVLELVLVKRYRRGNYQDGKTNADTFWYSVVTNAPPHETLALEHPPTAYYSSHCEDLPAQQAPLRLRQRGEQEDEGGAPLTRQLPAGEGEKQNWLEGQQAQQEGQAAGAAGQEGSGGAAQQQPQQPGKCGGGVAGQRDGEGKEEGKEEWKRREGGEWGWAGGAGQGVEGSDLLPQAAIEAA